MKPENYEKLVETIMESAENLSFEELVRVAQTAVLEDLLDDEVSREPEL